MGERDRGEAKEDEGKRVVITIRKEGVLMRKKCNYFGKRGGGGGEKEVRERDRKEGEIRVENLKHRFRSKMNN